MHILKCKKCNSYGLALTCTCGNNRERVIPQKFSPEDKYGKYRRLAKKESEQNV